MRAFSESPLESLLWGRRPTPVCEASLAGGRFGTEKPPNRGWASTHKGGLRDFPRDLMSNRLSSWCYICFEIIKKILYRVSIVSNLIVVVRMPKKFSPGFISPIYPNTI
jgi:hypothetical protein